MQTLGWIADCLALVVLMVGVVLRYRKGDNLPGFLAYREPDEPAPEPAAAHPPRRHRTARPARRRAPADRHA